MPRRGSNGRRGRGSRCTRIAVAVAAAIDAAAAVISANRLRRVAVRAAIAAPVIVAGPSSPLSTAGIFQCGENLLRVLRTLVRRLLEAPHDQRGKRRGDIRASVRERRRILREVRREQCMRWTAVERSLSGECLIGGHAERIQVDAIVCVRVGGDLFGRHVARRA